MSNDLYSEYNFDVYSDAIRTKDWLWLRHRIQGLLSSDTRIVRWVQTQAKKV